MSINEPKMLIVDDELDICLLLKDIFKNEFDVNYAQSIAEAKKFLHSHSFKILLLDLDLPDGSGFDLLDHFEDGYKLVEKPKVMIISAHKGSLEMLKAERYGVESFIEKPLDVGDVKNTVAQLIS
ncbi:response regulator [bacterium]|nr:response regulator [bacterium]